MGWSSGVDTSSLKKTNEVYLQGKICSEIRCFKYGQGKQLGKFSLAFYNGKKDGKSSYGFIDITAFDPVYTESVGILARDAYVIVQGRLGFEQYTNKMGAKVNAISIIATNISLQEERPEKKASDNKPQQQTMEKLDWEKITPEQVEASSEYAYEDIPF